MARFSLGREEDEAEEAPGSSRARPCPKRRKTSTTAPPNPREDPWELDCCTESSESDSENENEAEAEEGEEEEEGSDSGEEEEEEEEEDGQEEEEELLDNRQQQEQHPNGAVSITLTDPDVLDCPICLESLYTPVFQCENGHVACEDCCMKIQYKCPSCSWPIGYNRCRALEKVLESVKVSCRNLKYGCSDMMKYSRKSEHEKICLFEPCSCPVLDCPFKSSSSQLVTHFNLKHPHSAKAFVFNSYFTVHLGRTHKSMILYEGSAKCLFVLSHSCELNGRVICIVRIAPAPNIRLSYDLIAKYDETTITLHSRVESTPRWTDSLPKKNFIHVPNYCTAPSNGSVQLDVRICRS